MPAFRTRLTAALAAALLAFGAAACEQDGAEPSTTTEQGDELPVPGEEGSLEPSPSPDTGDVPAADEEEAADG